MPHTKRKSLAIGGASVHSLFAAVVGVMLTTFRVYWIGEGIGIAWPGDDFALLCLAATIFSASLMAVRMQRTERLPSA